MRINTQRRAVVLCATLLGTSLATHADENDASQGERELIETMTVIAPLRSPGQVTLFTGDVASGRETGDLLRDMQTRVDDDPWVGSGLDTGPTPGWLSVNLNARYRLSEQLRLDAGIDNLFDRFYAEHLNRASTFDVDQVQVNEPGRSLWLRLGMEF